MSLLKVVDLHHAYEEKSVFEGLNLEIKKGEIHCLLGPSGCGKSTFLKCLTGFETPNKGEIHFNESVMFDGKVNIAPEKRKIGLVFQDYSLFPHLNIKKNIAFGLDKMPKERQSSLVSELLHLVNLNGYEDKFPHELSGGEQQRVAIARALAPNPSFILLDEPFSNLDPGLRRSLRAQLKSILKEKEVTAIFITHDQQEAFELGDRISILKDKKIIQTGTPLELYETPADMFVANFIGSGIFLDAEIDNNSDVQLPFGKLSIEVNDHIIKRKKTSVYFPLHSFHIGSTERNPALPVVVVGKSCSTEGLVYDLEIPSLKKHLYGIRCKQDFKLMDKVFLNFDISKIKKAF
jgi:iron(III) transport system ATP-binding protein